MERWSAPRGGTGVGSFGWIGALAEGPGTLAPDVAAGVRLAAWASNYAQAISADEIDPAVAAARLSLCAICRPDLIQRHLDQARARPVEVSPVLDWPPRAQLVDVLAAALEVTAGRRDLAAPDGVLVQHLTRDHGPAAARQRILRITRAGTTVAEVTTVAELADQLGGPDTLEQLSAAPVSPVDAERG